MARWTVRRLLPAAACVVCCAFAGGALAYELVVNGSFEANGGPGSGSFSGWSTFAQPGSQGGFKAQTGTKAPQTPFTVPAPPGGTYAAMSDQSGPGGYVMYQDVAIPAGLPVTLTARVFVLNEAQDYFTPEGLDFATVPNQQARFDIVSPGAGVQDTGAGVLMNLFRTQVGDAPLNGYITINADLSAYAGQTIRLRFAETDNGHGLHFGADLVSVLAVATLDIDGSDAATRYDALTDGLLVLRYMFGLIGAPLTANVVGATATRTDPISIKTYLDGIRPVLDVDGNGTVDALTDGLLMVRYLFGLRGAALTANAVAGDASRTPAQIETYIQSLMP